MTKEEMKEQIKFMKKALKVYKRGTVVWNSMVQGTFRGNVKRDLINK